MLAGRFILPGLLFAFATSLSLALSSWWTKIQRAEGTYHGLQSTPPSRGERTEAEGEVRRSVRMCPAEVRRTRIARTQPTIVLTTQILYHSNNSLHFLLAEGSCDGLPCFSVSSAMG